ncbi:hypothetical protein LINPERHAP1_LOCUS33732 [Linum perenne]
MAVNISWCSDSSSWPPPQSFTTFYGGRRQSTTITTRKKKQKVLPFMDWPRYSMQGFNPLFESTTEAELNRIRSSPPLKFKFMRDVEDKLLRRLLEEANNDGSVKCPTTATEARERSFLGFLKNREAVAINRVPLSSQITRSNSEN